MKARANLLSKPTSTKKKVQYEMIIQHTLLCLTTNINECLVMDNNYVDGCNPFDNT